MSGAAAAAADADARAELAALLPLGDAFARAVAAQGAAVAAAPPARPASYVVNRHGEQTPVRFDLITERNEVLRSHPAYGPPLDAIDSALVTAQVVRRFRNGMTTRELDAETAAICFQLATHHDDYECLAARLHVSDLHKRVPAGLAAAVAAITAAAPDPGSVRVGGELARVIRRAAAAIDARLVAERDYRFRFFGWQTLARGYLLRPTARREESTLLDDQPMERPQHLYMRIALGVFVCRPGGRGDEAPEAAFAARLADAFAFYDALSTQRVSNATPTMLNAGTIVPQLSSCFQLATGDDLGTLFDTVKTAAMTSKWSGGVSLWLHGVRAEGALIRKTGGRGSGVKRYIKILQEVQLYVDQGGNRPGAFATYLGVDHDDVFTYIAMARPKGEEALKSLNAPDLKYALWVPDLFMEALLAQIENIERVEAGGADDPAAGDWHLFSPDTAPGLHLVWGAEYRALVARYVAEGRHRRVVKAGDVVREAFKTWAQNGGLYWLHKDHVNRKSNLQNVAPICSSNLCCEITLPSWSAFDAPDFARFHPDNGAGGEFGVCNLAAVCLESFLVERAFRCEPGAEPGTLTAATGSFAASSLVWHDPAGGQARAAARGLSGAANMAGVKPSVELRGWGLDYVQIMGAAALELRALDRVIDLTFYPSEECRRSNQRHRPVGIGIMGLANVLARLGLAYGSPEACAVARAVAAAVYLGALRESCRLAEEAGPYASFAGSPISEGRLQPDLWVEAGHLAPGWEEQVAAATGGAITPAMWAEARAAARRGVRNGYLTADMPTASTSNIVGQNESFEPFTSNLYTRRTNAGEFTIANRHLMAELTALGLWDDRMRREVIAAGGSVQGIERIPADVRRRYKTAREVHPSLLGRMAAAIAPFVCQSMSLNAYFDRPDLPRILRFLTENWRAGLKTGMYYCHTQPAAGAQKASARSGKQKPAPGGLVEQLDAAAAAPVRDRLGPPRECVPAADGTCTMCAL